jgi:UDP-N-acetylglucosamine 2-epimerase (non-hydrolysing)
MMKVLSVIGTRPEAIKMAPVIRELDRFPDTFASRVCVTGQHREMLDQVLELCAIEPDHDLDVMRRNQSPTDVAVEVMSGIQPILESERPDWVLVQGDTVTAMAASLAAFYGRASVGHVEAGLRTDDRYQPFPEEVNRRITGVVADLHFAPTEWAAGNLRREHVPEDRIVVTGNTVIDAFRHVAALPFDRAASPLAGLPLGDRRIVVVTAHRRENHGRGIEEICAGIRALADHHEDIHVVLPVHPNPNVLGPISMLLGGHPSVTLLPPLDYQPLVQLLAECHLLITDSGGLQEEATGVGKPVLVLRETTERPEGVWAGNAKLIGACRTRLFESASLLLSDEREYAEMARATSPYGDGQAGSRIVEVLAQSQAATVKEEVAA